MKKKILLFFLLLNLSAFSQDSRGSIATKKESAVSPNSKRALIIGISNYNEESLRLKYAENDAALFKEYLSQVEHVPEENIHYLTDEDAIYLNIGRELKQLYENTNSGDIVYLYFAGHGDVVDDYGGKEGFLLTADANAQQEYFAGGAIPLEWLNDKVISNIIKKGAQVVLILDACRSGFIFQEGTKKNYGTIQAMFENSTKILSCGQNELSFESSELKHGYFTYYLVQGLMGNADSNSDKELNYRELDDFLYDNVYTGVSKKHNQKQTPVIRTANDRATFRTINNSEDAIVFADISNFDLESSVASRSVLEAPKNNSEEKDPRVKQFSEAIKQNKIYGSESSAHAIFKSLEQSDVAPGVLRKLKNELIRELATPGQVLINSYMSGEEPLPKGAEFSSKAKELEICLQLLEDDDFLIERLKASKLLLEAYALIRSKNYQEYHTAIAKLKEALKLEPRAAYIHNALGLVYKNQKHHDSASIHFEKAKELIGTWSNPINNMGENFLEQFEYEKAKESLTQSLGTGHSDANANITLGMVYENEGRYRVADSLYKKALDENPRNIKALKRLAGLAKTRGNVAASEEWLNKALGIDSLNTLLEYGIFNYMSDFKINNNSTESLLKKVIEYEPHYSNSYSQYADFLRVKERKVSKLKLADSMYVKAIEKDPYNIWAYAGRGWLYEDFRNRSKAKEIFESGIKNNSNRPQAYYYYGNYLSEGLGDMERAEVYYSKAIEKDIFYMPAYTKLIEVYNKQGKQQKSLTYLNELIDKYPEAPDLWDLLGNTYFSLGEYRRAIESFNQSIKLDDSYTKGLSKLGYSELQENQYESAKSHYFKLHSSDPEGNKKSDIAVMIISMAKEKSRFGTPDQAKELYNLAFELDPNFDSGFSYSEFLYLNSDPEKSFNTLLKVLPTADSQRNKISVLELLVKAAIDMNDLKSAEKYFNELINFDSHPDLFLASVYFSFKGDHQQSQELRRKTNPHLVRSPKLKEIYSNNTITNYILY